MQTSLDRRDLWGAQHRDCTVEPTDLDMDLAQFLRATHAGHGPECRQYLAAAAYLYGRGEHN
ncbi:hypothetical protein IU443_17180 [Nocardia farcinica]|uniref:Uncharacterized protein n=2 Tax=Nocardia farcinica TaxID=37329 RepID=Q5YS14_NOCFA|nr:hypothetical protein [Nocardia farcinica]PEH77027.1 hypothetical protein CRM89_14415 [Nocardia sp. FDAARGOS_372]SLI56629.1 Uncharacterised protein [Mycobacteroides abscessus subsp. abscessus]BAD59027.1 hypothetical protein NFA_41780 [Nocardia farcinica IFM 10152]AXK88395.1 hypothetical protein DXT66_24755 [Nocardia farcinica]MBF6071462.1 hypothetical protein [Nocardia farcinica]